MVGLVRDRCCRQGQAAIKSEAVAEAERANRALAPKNL
jgi:hypothetical protein